MCDTIPVARSSPSPIVFRRIPVIIVPGIMGTRLEDPRTHTLVWNPMGYPAHDASPIAADDDRLARMGDSLEPDEHHEYPVAHSNWLRAHRIPHFYNLVAAFYDELAFAMNERLPRTGFRAYACGYDWRQDNAISARRLAGVVDEALDDTGARQVIIIAHSMGGLVSRYYCKELGGEAKVRALILLGSPSHGAPKAYRMLKLGLDWWTDTAMGFILRMGEDSRHMLHRLPSVFQLLPTTAYLRHDPRWLIFHEDMARFRIRIGETDPVHLYKDDWAGIHEIIDPLWEQDACKRNVDTAIAFHRAIEGYTLPNTVQIVSRTEETEMGYELTFHGLASGEMRDVRGLTWLPKRVDPRIREDGDGTVPTFSAQAFTSRLIIHVPGVGHDALANNPDVIRYLLSIVPALSYSSSASVPTP